MLFDRYQSIFADEFKTLLGLGGKKVDTRTSGIVLVILLARNEKGEHWVSITHTPAGARTRFILLEKFILDTTTATTAKEGAKKAYNALILKTRAGAASGLGPSGTG